MAKYKLRVTKELENNFSGEILLAEIISQDAKLAMYDYAEAACAEWGDGTYIFELYCEQNGISKPASGAPMFSYTVKNGVASLNEKRFKLDSLQI